MGGEGVSHWPDSIPRFALPTSFNLRIMPGVFSPVFLKTTQAQAEGLGVEWTSILCIRHEGSGLTMVPETPALLRWKPPFLGGRERSAGKSGN